MKKAISIILEQAKTQPLWDEILAGNLALKLERTSVTPNMVTSLSFLLALTAGLLFSTGNIVFSGLAGFFFMLIGFLDHLDGALARTKNRASTIGYYYDWFTDTFSYTIFFASIGIGFRNELGELGVVMVIFAVSACLLNTAMGLHNEHTGTDEIQKGFPSFAGFSIDDGMYLLGPICWAGYLYPFYLLCLSGAIIYVLIALFRFNPFITDESGMQQ